MVHPNLALAGTTMLRELNSRNVVQLLIMLRPSIPTSDLSLHVLRLVQYTIKF